MAVPTYASTNLYFVPASDPTGANPPHPTCELVFKDAAGVEHHSGFKIFENNTAGFRGYTGNGGDASVFEVDPANGRLVIQAP